MEGERHIKPLPVTLDRRTTEPCQLLSRADQETEIWCPDSLLNWEAL